MARIKVTGYVNTGDLIPEFDDPEHETGLTSEGFEHYTLSLGLEDIEFERVED